MILMVYKYFLLPIVFASSLLVAIATIAHSQENKKIEDGFYFGVGVHLGQNWNSTYASPKGIAGSLSELGVTSTRDDLPWDILDAESSDNLSQVIGKMGVGLEVIKARPVIILKGDRKKLPGIQPKSSLELDIYKEFVTHSAIILKDHNPIFEVWNEWNMAAKKDKSLGSAAGYVELAKVAYPSIKAHAPDSIVLAGAVGDDKNWKWTIEAVQLGLLDYADGISIHPYNYCSRLSPRTGWHALRSAEDLYNNLKEIFPEKDVPIYITEIGWPDQDGVCGGIPQEIAAKNVAQILLEAPTFPWLKGVWFYELLDQGEDPQNREHHFGLYDQGGSIKPAGCAAKTVWSFIKDTDSPALKTPYWKTSMAVFQAGGGSVRVGVWDMETSPLPRWIKLPSSAKPQPICGNRIPQTGRWQKLGSMPFLAELPKEDLSQIEFKEGLFP